MREWRIALLISILCMAAIAVAILRPDIFTQDKTKVATQSHYEVPVKPAAAPAQPKPASLPTQPTATTPKMQSATGTTKDVAKGPTTHTAPATKQTPVTRYYVQLATFQKRASAEKMVTKLQHTGLHLRIIEKSGMHAIWAGPWATRKQASSVKDEIYRKMRLKGFITQR